MTDFYKWLSEKDVSLVEFITQGSSEDWTDQKAASQRLNDERYSVRGIRSKYVANMSAEKKTKLSKRPK